jgi:hypothetical protein
MNDLKKAFDAFLAEFIGNQEEFRDFKSLYYESPKRINLLNEVSDQFFARLFWIYVDRIILNACKMTLDPKGSGDKENLSLEGLESLFSSNGISIPNCESAQLYKKQKKGQSESLKD